MTDRLGLPAPTLAAHYRARADRQCGPDAEADLLPLLDRTIYRLGWFG